MKKFIIENFKEYKIETKKALDHFDTIIKHGQEFLIDRGDLSKEISIISDENIISIRSV